MAGSAVTDDEYAQYVGKLVRLKLNRGILKDVVGVLLSEDSQSIRISEPYSSGHFYVHAIPKALIERIKTLGSGRATGRWTNFHGVGLNL